MASALAKSNGQQVFLICRNLRDVVFHANGTKVYTMAARRYFTNLQRLLHLESRKSLCLPKVPTAAVTCRSRCMSTQPDTEFSKKASDPFSLVETELAAVTRSIKKEIGSTNTSLFDIAEYYFDGKGKLFRPMLVLLMAKALNVHVQGEESVLQSQQQIAMIAEMIHTASLMHDDVIDCANLRRGKPSINHIWGQRKSILAGDFVMSVASIALARIRNEGVVSVVSQITEDLVRGEFMQLGSKENEEERYAHYLTKTFKKTASLLANSCRAVAMLAGCETELADSAYNYGRNIGISFQLIDDLLDFTSCDNVMGKPTAADLKLGLATAPVLFAAQKYPELNPMIMRRFSVPGDVEKAREFVAMSDGVSQTMLLAEQHGQEALAQIKTLTQSDYVQGLTVLVKLVLNRDK